MTDYERLDPNLTAQQLEHLSRDSRYHKAILRHPACPASLRKEISLAKTKQKQTTGNEKKTFLTAAANGDQNLKTTNTAPEWEMTKLVSSSEKQIIARKINVHTITEKEKNSLNNQPASVTGDTQDPFREHFTTQAKKFAAQKISAKPESSFAPQPENPRSKTVKTMPTMANKTRESDTAVPIIKNLTAEDQKVMNRGAKEEENTPRDITNSQKLPRIDPVTQVLKQKEENGQWGTRSITTSTQKPVKIVTKKIQRSAMLSPKLGKSPDQGEALTGKKIAGTGLPSKPASASSAKPPMPLILDTSIPNSNSQDISDEEIRNGLLAGKAKRDEFFDYLRNDNEIETAKTPRRYWKTLLVISLSIIAILGSIAGVSYAWQKTHFWDWASGKSKGIEKSTIVSLNGLAPLSTVQKTGQRPYLLLSEKSDRLILIAFNNNEEAQSIEIRRSDLAKLADSAQQLPECLGGKEKLARPYYWQEKILRCKKIVLDDSTETEPPADIADEEGTPPSETPAEKIVILPVTDEQKKEFLQQGAIDPLTDNKYRKLLQHPLQRRQTVTFSADQKHYWIVEQISGTEIKIEQYQSR